VTVSNTDHLEESKEDKVQEVFCVICMEGMKPEMVASLDNC